MCYGITSQRYWVTSRIPVCSPQASSGSRMQHVEIIRELCARSLASPDWICTGEEKQSFELCERSKGRGLPLQYLGQRHKLKPRSVRSKSCSHWASRMGRAPLPPLWKCAVPDFCFVLARALWWKHPGNSVCKQKGHFLVWVSCLGLRRNPKDCLAS